MNTHKAFVTVEDGTGIIRDIAMAHPYPDRKDEKSCGNCTVVQVSFELLTCLFKDCPERTGGQCTA